MPNKRRTQLLIKNEISYMLPYKNYTIYLPIYPYLNNLYIYELFLIIIILNYYY
jgi:hypothetical protein